MTAYVDESAFPIITVTFPAECPVPVIDALFVELEHCLDKHTERCAVIVNLSAVNPVKATARERQAVAAQGTRLRETFARHLCAEIRIIPNTIVRGFAIAIDWMTGTMSWTRHTVATLEEANRLARAAIEREH